MILYIGTIILVVFFRAVAIICLDLWRDVVSEKKFVQNGGFNKSMAMEG